MSVKNWNFSYKSYELEGKHNLKQNMLDTLSLWGSIGLLWCAFLSIIGEHFPEYRVDWFTVGSFLLLLWMGYEWPKNYLKRFTILCRIVGIGVLIFYIVANFEKILDGIVGLAWYYLPFFNTYYKTTFYMGIPAMEENTVIAFTAICMILWWFVWIFAYGWKRKEALVLFPIGALGLELLVGLSPKGSGLWYVVFAIALLLTADSASIVKKMVALACVGVSLLLSSVLFRDDINRLTTIEQKKELLDWQSDFSFSDFNLLNLFQIDLHFSWEQLNNNTPKYTGKVVLEIESDKRPITTVYLKGFYATTYDDGNWTYDDSVFRNACKEDDKSQQEVAEQIFQMPYERVTQYHDTSIIEEQCTRYKITYVASKGNVAYVPYGSDYESMDEKYALMGDYLLKKSIWDKTIEVSSQGFSGDLYPWDSINYAIEKGFGNVGSIWAGYYEDEINLKDKLPELKWFNRLSEAYLQVPESADFVDYVALEIDKNLGLEVLYLDDEFLMGQYGGENYRRLLYARAVKEYLASHMSYSLELDSLPSGADPIEYALNVSHEGYCMHFASAATLLLREFDVPARYVSGYAVDRMTFQMDEKTGLYKAEVGDFMAHAWVEIYLDNIGWVHFEVTPGSSLENLPTKEDIARWEATAEAFRDTFKEETASELESEEVERSSEGIMTETEELLDDTQEQNSEELPLESESDNTGGSGHNGDEKIDGGKVFSLIWKVLCRIVGIGGFCVLVFFGSKCLLAHYEKILAQEVKRNKTRKAVKRINRRIWNKLRFSMVQGVWKNWTDAQYRDALAERFVDVSKEDWNKYMDIVKKNHYSHEKITVEEMEFCYQCYKKIRGFHLKKKD